VKRGDCSEKGGGGGDDITMQKILLILGSVKSTLGEGRSVGGIPGSVGIPTTKVSLNGDRLHATYGKAYLHLKTPKEWSFCNRREVQAKDGLTALKESGVSKRETFLGKISETALERNSGGFSKNGSPRDRQVHFHLRNLERLNGRGKQKEYCIRTRILSGAGKLSRRERQTLRGNTRRSSIRKKTIEGPSEQTYPVSKFGRGGQKEQGEGLHGGGKCETGKRELEMKKRGGYRRKQRFPIGKPVHSPFLGVIGTLRRRLKKLGSLPRLLKRPIAERGFSIKEGGRPLTQWGKLTSLTILTWRKAALEI